MAVTVLNTKITDGCHDQLRNSPLPRLWQGNTGHNQVCYPQMSAAHAGHTVGAGGQTEGQQLM